MHSMSLPSRWLSWLGHQNLQRLWFRYSFIQHRKQLHMKRSQSCPFLMAYCFTQERTHWGRYRSLRLWSRMTPSAQLDIFECWCRLPYWVCIRRPCGFVRRFWRGFCYQGRFFPLWICLRRFSCLTLLIVYLRQTNLYIALQFLIFIHSFKTIFTHSFLNIIHSLSDKYENHHHKMQFPAILRTLKYSKLNYFISQTQVINRLTTFYSQSWLLSFSNDLVVPFLTLIILVNKTLKVYFNWLPDCPSIRSSSVFPIVCVWVEKAVSGGSFKEFDTWHWFSKRGPGFSLLNFLLKGSFLRFKLLVDDFVDLDFFLLSIFEDVFGLKTGDWVAGFLYDLVEHFLMLLLDFEGLYFFIFFRTFHFFLDGTLLTLLNFSLFVHDFEGSSSVKKLFHFALKVQVFVAFNGLVVFDSVSVELDEIADDLLWWGCWKFKLDFVVENSLGKVWWQLDFMNRSLHSDCLV